MNKKIVYLIVIISSIVIGTLIGLGIYNLNDYEEKTPVDKVEQNDYEENNEGNQEEIPNVEENDGLEIVDIENAKSDLLKKYPNSKITLSDENDYNYYFDVDSPREGLLVIEYNKYTKALNVIGKTIETY
ncbi:MAG: hypothetical protein E7172_03805 [Firmicutes bacterium]|nr:hypothetical protein [Bacillota bacterium]